MSTPTDKPASSCKVMLSKHVANHLLSEVHEGLKTLEKPPHLVGLLANNDPAALMYAQMTQKTCEENGFKYTMREVSRDDIEQAILNANTDNNVDGIIVYYPIFGTRQDQYLQQIVDMTKDVEGLSHRYIFNMYQNIRFLDDAKRQKSILPCTPLANIKILEYLNIYNTILPYGNRLHGHTICVVNRSEVVGRPLAALLANDGACVYSVDITGVQKFTRGEGLQKNTHEVVDLEGKTLKDVVPLCDVVITGVPSDKYKFDTSLLREGAVCVNFSSEKNFPYEVRDKASLFVPSIGKVTIVVLLRNLLRLIQNKRMDDVKPAEATERPGTLEASS
ncbi:Tetrahydrofolate dehydrogenase/cyclohydrolase [Penicillium concentricum]|uniref:Methylenetetrahydrofolate dehydrogenase [NAD(+)] n=1 Tax=Penicillium concentricum TaxID=293559 RepID=A0A9W9S5N3_9EURO|nr:Tetrahydrofolate dehydrogenase/cyclohydrolase [Penicillium concentricum]KAJ5371820.1 Tetrahydrofolate dehydrogenase/cyclohydrolase [Penicillium concentricum]